eukprot:scaffold8414_cov267-Pinguiococcus_pyrenoidosus.AAC.3
MALLTFLMFATFGLLIVFPPTRYVLRKFVLPKPGEGPSEEQMLSSYLTIVGKATGSRGRRNPFCIWALAVQAMRLSHRREVLWRRISCVRRDEVPRRRGLHGHRSHACGVRPGPGAGQGQDRCSRRGVHPGSMPRTGPAGSAY